MEWMRGERSGCVGLPIMRKDTLVGRNMDDMPCNLWGRRKFLGGGQICGAKGNGVNLCSVQGMSEEQIASRSVQRTHPKRESMVAVIGFEVLDIR